MTLNLTQKIALGTSGATSLGIGAFILAAPHAFYASYGIALGPDPSLLSELRAPGAGLVASGAIMLAGIFRQGFAQVAVAFALTVFLTFPAGWIVGMAVDGIPSAGILAALVLELAIAAFCLFAFRPGPRVAAPHAALR
jgi:hypothetical protein